MKSIGPSGCWHGDNCSLVHCVFYSCFLEDSKDVQFESVLSLCLTEHCVVIHCLTHLKGPICEHTHRRLKWKPSPLCCFHCSLCGYLPMQATQRAPVGILAHLPMPAGRRGTSKCAARCASPAQWDIHCTAQQRGSASPTGPGQADSHSANVREILKMSL